MNISGILFALLATLSFGTANMVDAQLTQKSFKTIGVLLFYSCMLNLVFTVPVMLHPKFAWPQGSALGLLILSSQIRLLSYYTLYHALRRYDTSIVTCITTLTMSLIPVISAMTGYEALHPKQWGGFVLCVLSAVILSYHKTADKNIKRALLFALCCGLLFVAASFIDDHLSSELHWSAQYAGLQVFMLVPMMLCLLRGRFRRDVIAGHQIFRKNLPVFFASEAAFAAGSILLFCAFRQSQVSVVQAIIASMPVMIFALSFFLPKKWVNDDLSHEALPRKLACFALTILGVYLLY